MVGFADEELINDEFNSTKINLCRIRTFL